MKTLPFNPDLFCKSQNLAVDEPFNYDGFEYYVRTDITIRLDPGHKIAYFLSPPATFDPILYYGQERGRFLCCSATWERPLEIVEPLIHDRLMNALKEGAVYEGSSIGQIGAQAHRERRR